MLILSVLVAINAEHPIKAHARGNLKVGNSIETIYAAVLQALPYIGFPYAINAINIIASQ